jgi:ParB-like chromosome segregation protein Spo0J
LKIRDRILELRRVPASELRPNPKNWRTHPQAQADALKGVLAEIGIADAVLARELDDGSLMLLDGHLRVETMGDQILPVLVLDVNEAEGDKVLATLDPLAAMAESDAAKLDAILREVDTGSPELQQMLSDLADEAGLYQDEAKEIVEDEIPEPPVDPITKPGDLWILGEHRLLCGDSTKADDVERLMAGAEADAIVSDPPYGIGYEYAEHDDSDNDANAALVAAAFALGPQFMVWTPGLHNLARDITRFGVAKVLVWFKKFAAAGSGLGGASVWEPVLVVGAAPKRELKTDVIECMTDRVEIDGKSLRSLHTCPKPVKVYATLIESFTEKSHSVYEPFCGSGTTLIAAEQLGRKCYGMEISPQYCDVIVKRWETLTGKKAELDTPKKKTKSK